MNVVWVLIVGLAVIGVVVMWAVLAEIEVLLGRRCPCCGMDRMVRIGRGLWVCGGCGCEVTDGRG